MTRIACPRNNHCNLIPPAEMFSRVLPGRLIVDTDLPFEQRVERAWKRLLAGFEEDEQERLRDSLTRMITKENIDD